MAFKVGDRIELINDKYYSTDKGILKVGDIVTISGIRDTKSGTHTVYGFKEETTDRPHWIFVEDNFKLAENKKPEKPNKEPTAEEMEEARENLAKALLD